jgi:hypothetical protein
MPRVTMNEGNRHRTDTQPLNAPHRSPVPIVANAASANGSWALTINAPSTAVQRPKTEPTERSMSATIKT